MVTGQRAPQAQRSHSQGTADAQAGAVGKVIPFQRATKPHTEAGETKLGTISTSTQNVSIKIPVHGYIDIIYLEVVVTAAGNAAAVAFAADAPWTFLKQVQFLDPNSIPIFIMSGYQCYIAALLGGYRLFRPDQDTDAYGTTPGAGATGGSFKFLLPLFIGFGRDCLGIIPNMDASAQYRLEVVLGPSTEIYTTPPTTLPPFSIVPYLQAYSPVAGTDQFGNPQQEQPEALGTIQNWTVSTHNLNASENYIQSPRVGNYRRNDILIFRDNTGARSAAIVPTAPITYEWDNSNIFQHNPKLIRQQAYQWYGFSLPTGVLIYPRTTDPDDLPLADYGEQWWATLGSTKLALRFTPASAPAGSTMEWMVNDVLPRGNVFVMER